MTILDRLLPWRRKDVSTGDNPTSWFVDWIRGGEPTLSGISVTPESAMRMAAVWACIRVRSEDVAKTPCILYRRAAAAKDRATDHPLYGLIHDSPNPRMTAFEFKQMMQAQIDLRGNAYAFKEFTPRGDIAALWPINPTRVTVLLTPDGRDLFYKLNLPGFDDTPIPAEGILHLRGPSLDGIIGLSPIAYHRETIGLGIAAEKYGAALFGNSAQPRGVIQIKGRMDLDSAKRARELWEGRYRGVQNAHRPAILDDGMEWKQTGMSNDDAQYIELRKLQNQEIWRIYRVPAHKVGDLERSTYSNIEQQALEYLIDCLLSEFVRWEMALTMSLLTDRERQAGLFFEFLPDALLRGDIATRYAAYAVARNWGWLNVNEIRAKENMNSIGAKGEVFLEPLNMIEAGTPRPDPTQQVQPSTQQVQQQSLPSDAVALLALAAARNARPGE
jgi:HK97 family phage portal protein